MGSFVQYPLCGSRNVSVKLTSACSRVSNEAIQSDRIWEDKISSPLQGYKERQPICTHTHSQF